MAYKLIVSVLPKLILISVTGLIVLGTVNSFQVNEHLKRKPDISIVITPPTITQTDSSLISQSELTQIKYEISSYFQEQEQELSHLKSTLFDGNTITYLITLIITLLCTLGLTFLGKIISVINEFDNRMNRINETIFKNEIEDVLLAGAAGIYSTTLSIFFIYKIPKQKESFDYGIYRNQRFIYDMKGYLEENKLTCISSQNKKIIVNYLADAINMCEIIFKKNQDSFFTDTLDDLKDLRETISSLQEPLKGCKCKTKISGILKKFML